MTEPVAVVDLFSGPGGLAEGFSRCYGRGKGQRYHIALSVENEPAAYQTLRLRALLRKCGTPYPQEYYDFLDGKAAEPDWPSLRPKEWNAATQETIADEIGSKKFAAVLQERLAVIRSQYGRRTMLIGGPPCQAYSLAGRARIAGMRQISPRRDKRIYLYKQYANILANLQPPVAVMENVKGIISSRAGKKKIFEQVTEALRHAGGRNNYRLFALAPSSNNYPTDDELEPRDFVVRAEDYGIPQSRHRVFIVCLHRDIAERLPASLLPRLRKQMQKVSVDDVIGAMPKLRSGLSKGDNPAAWQKTVRSACRMISKNSLPFSSEEKRKFLSILARTHRALTNGTVPPRNASGGTPLPDSCPDNLRNWIQDENLTELPNNDTRSHMVSDLARYVFAATYSDAFGYSPKTMDFPPTLIPNHKSWKSGNFSDRYRVQLAWHPSSTITSHISKDGHYFIHPDAVQCRSLTAREAARLQTFPDNYFFKGNRTQQYVQIGNAVPPYLAHQIAKSIWPIFEHYLCQGNPGKVSGRRRLT